MHHETNMSTSLNLEKENPNTAALELGGMVVGRLVEVNKSNDKLKTLGYQWHHKIMGDEDLDSTVAGIVDQEVFPGYNTLVEPGKHKEYEKKYGEYAVLHRVFNDFDLPKILKNGLLSTNERLRRDGSVTGRASKMDILTGGAESVFTSTVSEKSLMTGDYDTQIRTVGTTTIVIKPEILDRLDWYAYPDGKQGGSTKLADLEKRVSADEMFARLEVEGYYGFGGNGSEQMFKTGIPVEAFAAIATNSPEHRESILAQLRSEGITEINGRPIEDFVQIAQQVSQMIDMSHNRKPREYDPTRYTPESTFEYEYESVDIRAGNILDDDYAMTFAEEFDIKDLD